MKRSEREAERKKARAIIDQRIANISNEDAPEIDVHKYGKQIEADYKLGKKRLSNYNFTLFKDYDEELIRQSFAKATRHKSLQMILSLSALHEKDWNNVTKEQVRTLLTKIMTVHSKKTGQETNTTYDHKKHLRLFLRWVITGERLRKQDEAEVEVLKPIKMRRIRNTLVRENLLDDKDMIKLSTACGEDLMLRALIWTAYDAGTRPTELLTLRIQDVRQESDGWHIAVDGKTGQRPIHLIKATPHLSTWLNNHPLKERTDWALFTHTNRKSYGNPLSYVTCNKRLKAIRTLAKISKKIYLNLFRHSEITNTSTFMPEALLKKRHGWTPDSKIPSNYQHMVQEDVKKSLHSHFGIETKEEAPKINQICENCAEVNGLDVDFCVKCNMPMSLEKKMMMKEKETTEMNRIDEKLKQSDAKVDKLTEIISEMSKKLDDKLNADEES